MNLIRNTKKPLHPVLLAGFLSSFLFTALGCSPNIITQAPVKTVAQYSRVATLPIDLVIQDNRKKKQGLLDSMERLFRDNLVSLFDDERADNSEELKDLLVERVNYNFLDLGFIPIERTRIQSILKESGFQQSGVTNAESAARLGDLSNAQSLFFGKMIVQINGSKDDPQIDLSFSGRLVTVREGAILLSGTLARENEEMRMENLIEMVDDWFEHVEELP